MKEKLLITLDLQISSVNSNFSATHQRPAQVEIEGDDIVLSKFRADVIGFIKSLSAILEHSEELTTTVNYDIPRDLLN